jgi:hypothetical protein
MQVINKIRKEELENRKIEKDGKQELRWLENHKVNDFKICNLFLFPISSFLFPI